MPPAELNVFNSLRFIWRRKSSNFRKIAAKCSLGAAVFAGPGRYYGKSLPSEAGLAYDWLRFNDYLGNVG